jgi:hypothetical protein
LLGALQVLTNRALEAGIAGRGLRQALAEFTQHADDNAAGFRKLGVEILDTEGNMRDLTDIAQQFNSTLGEQATDMEIMMTLMEDLNIRGATAFVHLVQNADEFAAAVDDLANSSGAAAEMAAIQQEGLLMQIQRLKNLFMAPFLLSENMARDVGELNRLSVALEMVIDSLSEIVVEGEGVNAVLTDTGVYVREVLISAVIEFGNAIVNIVGVIQEWSEAGLINVNMIKLYFLPMTILIKFISVLEGNMGRLLLTLYFLNKTIPFTIMITKAYAGAVWLANNATLYAMVYSKNWMQMGPYIWLNNMKVGFSFIQLAAAITSAFFGLVIGFQAGKWIADRIPAWIPIILGLAIAFGAMWVAAAGPGGIVQAMTTMKGIALIFTGFAGLGMSIGAIATATAPPEEQTYPELEAYMAQLEAPSYGSGGSTAGEDLYVRNLVYTDSNQAEYMQAQVATQGGT